MVWIIIGLCLVIWGTASIFLRTARKHPSIRQQGPLTGPESRTAPPQTISPAKSTKKLAQIKEIVAIVGGIVSTLVGIITIIEKLR